MVRNSLGSLMAACAISAIVCSAPANAQGAPAYAFSLPEQDLSISLREVSARTGRSIVAPADLVRGRRSASLSGTLTAEEAVRSLLAGSGLQLRIVGDALVIVAVGASDALEGTSDDGASVGQRDSIVVTGTHLRGGPLGSPVLVLDRDEIDRSGVTSVEQLLRKLPQNAQGGVNQENFEVSLPDQDVTDHGAGLNLRGLGQRATLVLLNGRRLAPSGFGAYVDVSLIPLSLIERVEILTDGASAIYGSDAVGGVVNFILRDRMEGLETTGQAGLATRGGGEQLLLSQAAGTSWAGGHAMVGYEYRLDNEIRAGERPFPVNFNPDNYLTPRERRHSVLATVGQELASGLTFDATGTYAHRSTARTYFDGVSPIPIDARAVADAVTASGELTYDIGGGWRARLEGSYALSDTDQEQLQPGGLEVANARAVRNQVYGAAVKIDGALFELPGGPVRAAVGAEARGESYRDLFESSALAPLIRDQRRSVRSLFGELSVPLVSRENRLPGIERLELSVAGRFDDYGGTGSNVDPKLGVVWSPVRGVSLRGSYGTSFRAPLLSEIGGNYTVIYAPAFFVYQDPAQAPPGSIAMILQGSNPALRPETSTTWSAGADLKPEAIPGLSLSLTYYSVKFADRIALPARFLAVVGNPAFEPIIDSSPDVAELTRLAEEAQLILDATGPGFSDGDAMPADVDILVDTRVNNTAETSTSGLDATVRYALEAGPNEFLLDLNVNHVLSFEDRFTSASPIVDSLDRVFGPLSWRVRGGVAWTRGPWSSSLYATHAGAYEDDRRAIVAAVDSWTTLDFSLSHAFGDDSPPWLRGSRIAVFAENLLDTRPPELDVEPGIGRGIGYDPVNASGRGRFVSLQLRKSW